ncbi:hypothetical protein [Dinghuibacter silviterrae]|uniref:Uncharacterized protein n=1 Tax=Dinghuibacter silviterrae TaxID=1539049 RepID=A0A4R8DSZ1_9BACT|nr:hypothetical protein [Dinghuibacter silviterrae]TDX01402.1 hypothetical protein EDB95_2436 [Dinghuibacter silviterrae]
MVSFLKKYSWNIAVVGIWIALTWSHDWIERLYKREDIIAFRPIFYILLGAAALALYIVLIAKGVKMDKKEETGAVAQTVTFGLFYIGVLYLAFREPLSDGVLLFYRLLIVPGVG